MNRRGFLGAVAGAALAAASRWLPWPKTEDDFVFEPIPIVPDVYFVDETRIMVLDVAPDGGESFVQVLEHGFDAMKRDVDLYCRDLVVTRVDRKNGVITIGPPA